MFGVPGDASLSVKLYEHGLFRKFIGTWGGASVRGGGFLGSSLLLRRPPPAARSQTASHARAHIKHTPLPNQKLNPAGRVTIPVARAMATAAADGTPSLLRGWFRTDAPGVEVQLTVQYVPYE